MIIALPQFKKAMDEALETHDEELTCAWNNPVKYTAVWERDEEDGGVYQSLAKKLGMKWYSQSPSLDAMFFEEWSQHLDDLGVRFLSLVIEHANQCNISIEKINRLLAASASLKVLVTYPSSGHEQKWLDKYEKQIKIFDDIWPGRSVQQRYVVIFGGEDKNKKSVWKYYIYRQGEFCSNSE